MITKYTKNILSKFPLKIKDIHAFHALINKQIPNSK